MNQTCPNCGAAMQIRLGEYECSVCSQRHAEADARQTALSRSTDAAQTQTGSLSQQAVPGSTIDLWVRRYRLEVAIWLLYTALVYLLIAWLARSSPALQILLGGFYAPRRQLLASPDDALVIYAQFMQRDYWTYALLYIAVIGFSALRRPTYLVESPELSRSMQINSLFVAALPLVYVLLKLKMAFGSNLVTLQLDALCWLVLAATLAGLAWYLRIFTLHPPASAASAGPGPAR